MLHQRERHPDDLVQVGRRALRLGAARKGQQVGDNAAHPGGLIHHLRQVFAKLFDAVRRNAVVLQHALQQHGEVEHAGDGIVDLVRHAGRKLSQGRQAVAVQQLFLRGLELLRALGHLAFQVLCELVDLTERGLQAAAHHFERARQLVQFFAAASQVERLVQLHVADRFAAFDQLFDGPPQKPAREEDDAQADQGDFDAGHQQHAKLHAFHFVIHAFQIQRQVQNAQHLHVGRMRMACRLAARTLVIDGGEHLQAAVAVGAAAGTDRVSRGPARWRPPCECPRYWWRTSPGRRCCKCGCDRFPA